MPDAPSHRGNALVWLWLTGLVICLDQVTKLLASAFLIFAHPLPLLPSVNFTLLHNQGAAFSFLANAGGWQRWFLTGLALFVSIVIIVWLSRLQRAHWWLACALALVLGGAMGNVIDRILYGYVIDFIDIYYRQWHWPAFNLADSAISVGAVMLVMDTLIGAKHR
jgi:signal peptidase II